MCLAGSPLPAPEMNLTGVRGEIGRLAAEEKKMAASLAGIALRAEALKKLVTD